MTSRIRLLRINIEPVFVVDDDVADTLTELVGNPITIQAKDWAEFSVNAFREDDLAAIQVQYEIEQANLDAS